MLWMNDRYHGNNPVTLDRYTVADAKPGVTQRQDYRSKTRPVPLSIDALDWILVARSENPFELRRLERQGRGGRHLRKLDGEDRLARAIS
jgi:hypothetical protein